MACYGSLQDWGGMLQFDFTLTCPIGEAFESQHQTRVPPMK